VQLAIPGHSDVSTGGARVIAQDAALPFVLEAIASAGTLYDYAARHRDAETIQGRGTVYVVPGPGSHRWVVRHLAHGGLLAPVTGDRFLRLGIPRPFNELRVALELKERDIPTPAVVAAAVYPSGLWYSGEVAREEIPDAMDLAACLFGESGLSESQRHDTLAQAGRLLGSLYRAGVIHPDLNLKNILVSWSEGAPKAHILDLEKCRIVPHASKLRLRQMFSRLRRSARRFAERTGRAISEDEWAWFYQSLLLKLRE